MVIIFLWLTNSQDSESSHCDKRIQVCRDRQYLLLEQRMQLEGVAKPTLSLNFVCTLTALVKDLCSQKFVVSAIYPQL